MVPVGYEEMPLVPETVFKKSLQNSQSWLIIGDNSKVHSPFHCVKWEDVERDLAMENPYYLDIRNLAKGVQTKDKSGKGGKNSHCFIEFTALSK